MQMSRKMSVPNLYEKPRHEEDCQSIPEAVWQLQQSCQFTDLVLSCRDGSVPVHKVMLAGVFNLLGVAGQEQDIECVILPGGDVAEVELALKDLYLKSESEKVMEIFSCRSIKTENLDASLVVEVKPEVPSEDECYPSEDKIIIQNLTKSDKQSQNKNPSTTLQTNKKKRLKHDERIEGLACNQCGYIPGNGRNIAKNVKRLQKHVAFNHEELKFICDFCDFKTAHRKDVESHKNQEHHGWKLLRRRKQFTCDQCDFVSPRKESLAFHKRKEHGVTYPCSECDKVYLTSEKLEVHINYAHDKRIYQCDLCAYQTNNKWTIRNHHKLKHTDEQFYCDQCQFISKTKTSLRLHVEAKHEGKRFYCEQCEYSAQYSGGLNRHIKMVHEGVTYQCDFCEHKATTPSNLKLHVDAKHLGIKYPCDLCDYKASQPGCLKIHKQTRH